MTQSEALKIIQDNFNSDGDSYLDFLHERDTFNTQAFWQLYGAIRLLGQVYSSKETLPRELTAMILKTYEWHLLLIGFHFDPIDGSSIENLPENFSQYSLRLKAAVNAYIEGNPISDETEGYLNEELQSEE